MFDYVTSTKASTTSFPPTTAPSTAPTTFAFVAAPSASDIKGDIVSYEVIITVTFQYTFSSNETNQIVIILAEMYRDISACPDQVTTELFKATVDYDHQSTIINASMTPCNASVEQSHLSGPVLVNKVKNETGMDLDPERTTIDIKEITDVLRPARTANSREELFQSDIVLWMVRIIGAQLALCCVLSFCVYLLRQRTRRLSKAKDEIIRVVRERRGEIKNDTSTMDSAVAGYNVDPQQMLIYPNNDSLTDSGIMHEEEDEEEEEVTTPSSRSVVPFDVDDQIDSEMMILNRDHGIWSRIQRGFTNQRRRVHTIVSDRSYPSIPHDTPKREGRKSESTHVRENQPLTLGITGSPTLTFSGPRYLKQRQTGLV